MPDPIGKLLYYITPGGCHHWEEFWKKVTDPIIPLLCKVNIHVDTKKTYDGEVLKFEDCKTCFKSIFIDYDY